MAVEQVRTIPLCKICKSERREDIERLLELRSNRANDHAGVRINADYVKRVMIDFGIRNPTLENIQVHWRDHCKVVDQEVVSREQKVLRDACKQLAAKYEGHLPSADEYPELILEIDGVAKLSSLAKGELPKITTDQALKAIDVKTRRKVNERVADLIGLTGEAIGLAIERQRGSVIEGEVVEEIGSG